MGSQQRFRVFLVGRGGREGRALDETRLVAVVVVIVLFLLIVAIVVFVVGIFLMNKFFKSTDWLQRIFSDAREEARKAEAADLSPPNSVKRRRRMIRMVVRRWRRR